MNKIGGTKDLEMRRYSLINWIGLGSICRREIKRFLSVISQTVVAPIVMVVIYLMVFTVIFPSKFETSEREALLVFLFPGLVMMSVVQNAFANSSSSLMIAKIQGCLADTLMPPLSALEILLGYVSGSLLRGLIIAFFSSLAILLWTSTGVKSVIQCLFFVAIAGIIFGTLGTIAGIWAKKFDHIATFTNFFITPFSFLSGTFFSPSDLSEGWRILMYLNPFYYLIDGFRDGIVSQESYPLTTGIFVTIGLSLVLVFICYRMLDTGYRIKN